MNSCSDFTFLIEVLPICLGGCLSLQRLLKDQIRVELVRLASTHDFLLQGDPASLSRLELRYRDWISEAAKTTSSMTSL